MSLMKLPVAPTPELINRNFLLFRKLIEEKAGTRAIHALKLVDHFSERLALAPASSRLQFHSAVPGGLVSHSLRVLKTAKKLSDVAVKSIDESSLVLSALFHDIGKVGDLDHDLYVQETSSWHVERGMVYKHNDDLRFMTVTDRSLWLMSHFDIKLAQEEWLAIRLNDGQYTDDNKSYKMNEGMLPLLIHQADRLACEREKEMYDAGEPLVQ